MTFKIPPGVLAQHTIALGKTGSGKSSSLRVLVEGLLDADKPVCIIDPKGDWWGIKSSADGKRAGYPIVIFGGEHADVPINEYSGAAVAELVGTGNRSCLIDLGGWMVGERTRFFMAFAAALFKTAKGSRHLVIDEVHNFAPQGKILDPDAGRMLHWANRLASEGRGKGITILAASQRPQKVHKDFLTSCETLIAKKVIHKLDRDAVKDWIDGCADPAKGREVISTLAQLKKPQAWIWSPEIDYGPVLIEFPLFRTFDSFKPQEADAAALKGWAQVDLEDVKSKLQTVVAETEANDPKVLKKRIAELERQARIPPAPSEIPEALRRSYHNEGFEQGKRAALEELQPQLDRQFDKGYRAAAAAIAGIVGSVVKAGDEFMVQLRAVTKAIDRSDPEPAARAAAAPSIASVQPVQRRIVNPVRTPVKTGSKPGAARVEQSDLPRGEVAILSALIQYPNGSRRDRLTVLTGFKKSTRDAYIYRLKERRFVEEGSGVILATGEGQAALPDAQPLPRGQELQDFWLEKLPDGESRILEHLIKVYPAAASRDELSEYTGFKKSTRDAYVYRMASKQLVTEPRRGEVRASEDLFA